MPSETLLSVSDGILTNTVRRRKTAGFSCVAYADVSTRRTICGLTKTSTALPRLSSKRTIL
ncbi:hypothetical protein [Neisseria meningitidis]|uniref:hypothetical protein n=1 Tax=Neisseria meningitidis TaxID=487 RepID=UPI00257585F7|nr:hypothetical protein [Neisseria meningitidis]MDM1030302.1 hypothetical protein [Neisseria meningitidis]